MSLESRIELAKNCMGEKALDFEGWHWCLKKSFKRTRLPFRNFFAKNDGKMKYIYDFILWFFGSVLFLTFIKVNFIYKIYFKGILLERIIEENFKFRNKFNLRDNMH